MGTSGMGAIPLTWLEIEAWLNVTELGLTVWEKLIIKDMSDAYVAELTKSTAKDATAPYTVPVDPEEVNRAAVSDKIGSILRGFKSKKTK